MNYYDAMKLLKAQEELRQLNTHRWECWLRCSKRSQMACHLYNHSHGLLSISLIPQGEGSFYLRLSISSIDDSMAGMTGPVESLEKALRRKDRAAEFVDMWNGQMPSYADFEYTAQQCGMGTDYN